MRYAIPRQTRKLLNSTNGFTIGKPYQLRDVSEFGGARVINDNGHDRYIPTDGGSNAHLQYRYGLEAHCAGVFDIVDIVTDYVHPPIPVRAYDWQAWIDGSEEDGVYGWGLTMEDAVRDLAGMIANGETRLSVDTHMVWHERLKTWTNPEVTR